MLQQITTFESTWDQLKPGGVYICEVMAEQPAVEFLANERAFQHPYRMHSLAHEKSVCGHRSRIVLLAPCRIPQLPWIL